MLRRFAFLQSSSPYVTCFRGRKKLQIYKQFRRRNDAEEIARDNFDVTYKKIFQDEWPSVRCAMLSRKKYCSVLNNFADADEYEDGLIESGAYDFIAKLHENAKLKCAALEKKANDIKLRLSNNLSSTETVINHDTAELIHTKEKHLEPAEDLCHVLEKAEDELSEFKKLQNVCLGLHAYVYPKANFTEFKEQVKDSLRLSFFLDASSVIPVLALNPQPGDHILDMCAAPGGKFNLMMQALGNSGFIVANDIDTKRVKRIKQVFREYVPQGSDIEKSVKIVSNDGALWNAIETECYSKVLVDVPCTTDRHSMYTPERDADNIFSELRKRERARLPERQSSLLKNAVLACQPGGTIVYSTCTISPVQNELVVQYTVQDLLQNHNIVCEIEDVSCLTSLLGDEFHFHKDMVLGALAYPRLDANFGPTFLCKIRRQH